MGDDHLADRRESGDADDVQDQLATAAREQDGELAELLERARDHIESQANTIAGLQQELEETNEGMVALTLELQEAEQRYRSLFEEAAEGIYKTTPDAEQYLMVNQSMADVLGYEEPATIVETVSIEDVFVDSERFVEYRSSLREHQELENFEYRIRRKGGDVRWVSDSVRSVIDADGQHRYRGGVIDITERKNYEKRLQERNEALEALNRVVRHDIRNDVQVISTWAETLESTADPDQRDALESITQKAKSITDITRETGIVVETLTGEGEIEREPVSLETTLVSEVERQQEAHRHAEFELPESVPFVQVQANEMLSSVFRNLLANAVTHNDSETPVVEIDCEVRDDDVLVEVADNGPGVPDDRKTAIFGKGTQSVKSDGTGIGLYLVNYLVTEYGGDVWVTDNEPTGAVFRLTLPRAN